MMKLSFFVFRFLLVEPSVTSFFKCGILFFLFYFSFFISSSAQNLVPNNSFEIYSACPTNNSSEVYLATPWIEVQNTADYYNCSALDNSYIARTGSGYMGVAAWRPGWGETYREYIGVNLSQPLTAGVAYYGEFWVRLYPNACWASDGMGMYVSINQPPDPPSIQNIPVNPQIMNPQYRMLIGREYWMKICGSFVANGGENFITIGSFLDDSQSTFLELPGCNGSYGVHWSYYHIDDVILEQYDSTANYDCDDTTQYTNPNPDNSDSTLHDCNLEIPNVISPNYDRVNDFLYAGFPLEKYTFYIYDRWGREVYYTWQDDPRDLYWRGTHSFKDLPDGVYYYVLTSLTENCEQKGTITILR